MTITRKPDPKRRQWIRLHVPGPGVRTTPEDIIALAKSHLDPRKNKGLYIYPERVSFRRILAAMRQLKNERDYYRRFLNEAKIGPDIEEHPEQWEGPCLCRLCQSYSR